MAEKKDVTKELRKPLDIKEVDFRVQSVSAKGYVTILAYKDARCDMRRLDEVVGSMNWKREHTRDNKNCIVSIWDEEKEQWVSKEDTGSESFADKEKGLASDSFKRACFNWGIGIELYDYPFIFFQLYPDEFNTQNNKTKTTFKFNLKKWKWNLEMNGDEIKKLTATDSNGKLRYDSKKEFNGLPNQNNKAKTEIKQPQQGKPDKIELIEGSENWKQLMKFFEEGKVTKLTQITKQYKVSAELTKKLEAKIEDIVNQAILDDQIKDEQSGENKTDEKPEKKSEEVKTDKKEGSKEDKTKRNPALKNGEYQSALKGTKPQIENVLKNFRMSADQRKELKAKIK